MAANPRKWFDEPVGRYAQDADFVLRLYRTLAGQGTECILAI